MYVEVSIICYVFSGIREGLYKPPKGPIMYVGRTTITTTFEHCLTLFLSSYLITWESTDFPVIQVASCPCC